MDRKRILAFLLCACLTIGTATSALAATDAGSGDIVYDIQDDVSIKEPVAAEKTVKQEIVDNPILAEIDISNPVTIDDNGNINIPAGGLTDLIIPEEISGHAVTNLKVDAFRGISYFKTVTIPDCITKIGANAFADCEGLEYIILQGRYTNADDLELGDNWAGDAEVVYEKIIKETVVEIPAETPAAPKDSVYSVSEDTEIIKNTGTTE